MTLSEKAQHLQELVGTGQIMDAIDTYFHDDVEIVEPNGDTFHGKETQKGRVADWMASLEEMHDGGVRNMAVHEESDGTGVVFIESWNDLTFKEYGHTIFEEVNVQTWKDGLVVRERFYYNMGPMGADMGGEHGDA